MKISGLLPCIFCLCVGSFAQQSPPAPAPAPAPKPQPAPKPAPQPQQTTSVLSPIGNKSRLEPLFPYDPFRDMNSSPSLSDSEMASLRLTVLHKYADPLYRKPTKDELQSVAPDPGLYERYREFLRRPNTGFS